MDTLISWFGRNPTFPIVLISALIAFQAFRTTRHLSRSKNAIDFESAYHQSVKLAAAMAKLLEWAKHADAKDTAALAAADKQEMVGHIRELLNTWERAAIAIKQNVYDDGLLYNAYGTSVIWIWKQTVPYMRRRQADNPRLYVNFDWLAIMWQIRRDSRQEASHLKKLKMAQRILREVK